MSYIGTQPKDIRSFGRTKFDYTATQGQTAFTGADDDGKVLAFTVGQIEVYVNGILMDDSDFTTTGTGTVTLASAANLNDVVNVVSFETNIPDSNYVPASGGTFTGNITASGTLGVTGAVTASNGLTVDDDGATPLTVDRATSDGTIIDVQKNGTSVATIGNSGSAGTIVLNTSGSSGVGLFGSTNNGGCLLPTNNTTAVDNAKDLGRSDIRWRNIYLSGGVVFDAVAGNATSNTLNDYEEGTCTLVWHGTGGTNDTSSSGFKYVKVGRMVNVTGNTVSTLPNATGALELQGLPFTADRNATGSILYRNITAATNQHTLVAYVGANSSKIQPYWSAQNNYDRLESTDFNASGSQDMYFSVTYMTT